MPFSSERIDSILGKAILGGQNRRVIWDSAFTDRLGLRQFATDHRMPIASLSLPVYPQ